MLALAVAAVARSATIEWVQTARDEHRLLAPMPPIDLKPLSELGHSERHVLLQRRERHQEILGFGGAFTEAAALNWQSLSPSDQRRVIRLYFASPEDGGLGYTVGRVPIGSCDFGPGGVNRTYSFAEEAGDTHLHHFDDSMQHDVDNGIIPMIHAAMAELERWTADSLSLVASPWSPPAWMKLPVGGVQSMIRTAQPNGLDPAKQRPYAHYFSRFLSGYAARGIDVWGVTIQNEAEAADVGWEKCVYTADYMASFVKEHLGPVLREEHPRVKIIGFDHNKDHVLTYARGLYADPAAAHYFDGIGMHWYGGLNTDNLDGTHALAPDKFLLATEACNCPGVIYEAEAAAEWWQRAEHLGMDILQDLLHWSVGWIDWNLILDTTGGPNHLGNRCDANLIADPHEKKKTGDSVVVQASYHYMGHFSRYLPRGSVRIGVNDTVEQEKPPGKDDLKNSQPMVFTPCEGSPLQSFSLDSGGMLTVAGTHFCLDVSAYGKGPRVDVYSCAHSPNQQWERRDAPSCPAGGQGTPACSLLISPSTDKCLTRVTTSGAAIGLDAGSKYTVAQALPCIAGGDPSQTFSLKFGDAGGFPHSFPIRSLATPGGSGEIERELCAGPYIAREPEFASLAFATPGGGVSVVAMNRGDKPLTFSLLDVEAGLGAERLTVPPHSISSLVLPPLDEETSAGPAPSPGLMAVPPDSRAAASEGVGEEAPGETAIRGALATAAAALAAFAVSAALRRRRHGRGGLQAVQQGEDRPMDRPYVIWSQEERAAAGSPFAAGRVRSEMSSVMR